MQECLLLDLVDEVELDTLGWHFEHRGGLAVIFVELGVGLVAVVICDLNNAVVLKTTLKSSFSRLRLPRLANVDSAAQTRWLKQASVNFAKRVINMQRAHPVACLDAIRIATGWVSKRRIEAVSVPVLAAVVAGNDCTPPKGRLIASVAEDTVAFVVLELEVIRLVVVTATAKCDTSAIMRKVIPQKGGRTYRVLGLTASVNSPFLAVATPSK